MSLEKWSEHISGALAFLRSPGSGIVLPPLGGSPEKRLAVLLEVRKILGPCDGCLDPWRGCIDQLASMFTDGPIRRNVLERLAELAGAVDREIAKCLEDGVLADGLIFSKAFSRFAFVGQTPIVAGFIDTLEKGHRLRSILPDGDFFRIDGQAVLLLGPAQPGPKARTFYPLAPALALTRSHRKEQCFRESEERRQVREREENERQRFANSPEGLRQRLKMLENGRGGSG